MKKVKALIVGAGNMGRSWARNLDDCEAVQSVGWVDIQPGAAAAAIENFKYSGITPYEDLDKALAEQKPDIVVDVTIPEAHHSVTLKSLAAGAHVLGEKPMADSIEHAREMVAASERAGKLYMVSQSRRYMPAVIAFRDAVREQIGPLGILKSDFFLGPHFGGFREKMQNVLLLDMAIHTFDNARQISGADPVAVYCEESNPGWSWYAHGSSANALFEMTGGLRYTYCGSWCAEGGLETSWQAAWRAYGLKGAATWDGEGLVAFSRPVGTDIVRQGLFRQAEPVDVKLPENVLEGIKGSLREFIQALETGSTPQGECHDNIKSLAMVFAAIESSATGKRVKIEA